MNYNPYDDNGESFPYKRCPDCDKWLLEDEDSCFTCGWGFPADNDEPCARCGLSTSERDDVGKPLCRSCYAELTMTGDEE